MIARVATLALDMLFPPRCLKCGGETDATGGLCADCWPKITFLTPPYCACCGQPFPYDVGDGALCGACTRAAPDYARARAVFVYGDKSRALVLAFKHADATHAAPAYGRWLARAGADLLGEADLVVPVPLHRRRLFMRRYNQAALLAHSVGKLAERAVAPDALVRVKATTPHIDMGRLARLRNVAGAFAVHPGWKQRIADKRILLVDDVFTTGATVGGCARVLLQGGARAVDVLTLARVVSGT
jgi:ComF family protein